MIKSSYRSLWLIASRGLLVTGSAAGIPVRHDGRAERASLRHTGSITPPESQCAAVTVSFTRLELGETTTPFEPVS
jgi:hypothetical protein